MGKQDVIKHCKTQGHLDKAKSLKSQATLTFSNAATSSDVLRRTEAEVRMAVLAASCNIPLAFHDQLSPAIRSLFPDSKIASKYHSASRKATCMLNLAIASELKKDLVENMKVHPYSVSIDGSNDTNDTAFAEGRVPHLCTSTTTLFSTQESPGEICQAINSCGEYTEGVIIDT